MWCSSRFFGARSQAICLTRKVTRQTRLVCMAHPTTSASADNGASSTAEVSQRVKVTDSPIIVKTKALMATTPGVLSLAQGIVYWQPPASSLATATEAAATAAMQGYGPCEGNPALREALREKLRLENGLQEEVVAAVHYEARCGTTGICHAQHLLSEVQIKYEVMVTSGANQAFVNIVLTLVDAEDEVILFAPYYFNHAMALQMTGLDDLSVRIRVSASDLLSTVSNGSHVGGVACGGTGGGGRNVVYAPCNPTTLRPDLDWLERHLTTSTRCKMCVIINPNNPTGVLMDREELQRANELCSAAGCWLVMDNTYEHFVYDGRTHHCIGGPNVLNIFSFSKAYGMMGWRVGYIAYPLIDGKDVLGPQLLKVQDTIPICTAQLPQIVALAALQEGRQWVQQRVEGLAGNRAAVLRALAPLGDRVVGGEGAIYYWAQLPEGCEDDEAVVEWLVKRHRVCIIPGSSCGAPGYIRVAFANLSEEQCAEACQRLRGGLQELVQQGASALKKLQPLLVQA